MRRITFLFVVMALASTSASAFAGSACENALKGLKGGVFARCAKVSSPANYEGIEPIVAMELCLTHGKDASSAEKMGLWVNFKTANGESFDGGFQVPYDPKGNSNYFVKDGVYTVMKQVNGILVAAKYSMIAGLASYEEIAPDRGFYKIRRSVTLRCDSVMF